MVETSKPPVIRKFRVMKSENIVPGIVVAICAAVLGFGVSQATLAVDVKTQRVEINQLKYDHTRLDNQLNNDRLMHVELIKQNQEFINLLKVQNELLMKRSQ